MDTPNNARKLTPLSKQLRDAYLRSPFPDDVKERLAKLGTERLTKVAEEIAEGDRAFADQILRRWGVRR